MSPVAAVALVEAVVVASVVPVPLDPLSDDVDPDDAEEPPADSTFETNANRSLTRFEARSLELAVDPVLDALPVVVPELAAKVSAVAGSVGLVLVVELCSSAIND